MEVSEWNIPEVDVLVFETEKKGRMYNVLGEHEEHGHTRSSSTSVWNWIKEGVEGRIYSVSGVHMTKIMTWIPEAAALVFETERKKEECIQVTRTWS